MSEAKDSQGVGSSLLMMMVSFCFGVVITASIRADIENKRQTQSDEMGMVLGTKLGPVSETKILYTIEGKGEDTHVVKFNMKGKFCYGKMTWAETNALKVLEYNCG